MTGQPSVSISIMAHPHRAAAALRLEAQLKPLPVKVVFDPKPDATPATLRTARLAWVPHGDDPSHHLVLQDDVLLHSDFSTQVIAAIASQPRAILSFFSEWGSYTSHTLRISAFAGRAWTPQVDSYLGTQAIAMPADAASSFAEYLAEQPEAKPDDHAVFEFAEQRGMAHYVSNPNLVDHDHRPSLVGNSTQGARRAAIFVPEWSADPQWWRTPPLRPPDRIPAIHWSDAQPIAYERCPGGGARRAIRPRQRAGGALIPEVDAWIAAQLTSVSEHVLTPRLHAAAIDVATTLCDQISVAQFALVPIADPIASRCVDRAVSTIAPGALRQLIGRRESAGMWSTLNNVLREAHQYMIGSVLPRVDVHRVGREFWNSSTTEMIAKDLSARRG